jgi:hypothetical protein
MIRGVLFFALVAAMIDGTAVASNNDLKKELLQKQKELMDLSSQIDQAVGPEFHSDRDVQLKLATDLIQNWARKVTTPDYAITAQGIAVQGDIDDGNGYKVWIDNPGDTKAALRFNPFLLTFSPQQFELNTYLTAHAEARVWGKALFINTNVFCATTPDVTTPVQAVATETSPTIGDVAYVVTLTQPTNLNAAVACGLGGLGNYTIYFPINQLAGVIAKGDFSLGYQNKIEITVPTTPPQKISINVMAKDQTLTIGSDMIEVEANLDVGSRP